MLGGFRVFLLLQWVFVTEGIFGAAYAVIVKVRALFWPEIHRFDVTIMLLLSQSALERWEYSFSSISQLLSVADACEHAMTQQCKPGHSSKAAEILMLRDVVEEALPAGSLSG